MESTIGDRNFARGRKKKPVRPEFRIFVYERERAFLGI